jgi:hypothetical protein
MVVNRAYMAAASGRPRNCFHQPEGFYRKTSCLHWHQRFFLKGTWMYTYLPLLRRGAQKLAASIVSRHTEATCLARRSRRSWVFSRGPARSSPFRGEVCFLGYFIYQLGIIKYINYILNTICSVFVYFKNGAIDHCSTMQHTY